MKIGTADCYYGCLNKPSWGGPICPYTAVVGRSSCLGTLDDIIGHREALPGPQELLEVLEGRATAGGG